MRIEPRTIAGATLYPGYLGPEDQADLLVEILGILQTAPLFTPRMPRTGKPFTVRMSNCGPLGWVSDKAGGYRYQATHPETGAPWPDMPAHLLKIWDSVSGCTAPPEACLINHYTRSAKMGLHRDEDEEDFSAPVVSISLGDTALFRIGGTARKGATQSFDLASGDVVVLGGEARLAYHGIDRVRPDTSNLLLPHFAQGGRINLTLRRVNA